MDRQVVLLNKAWVRGFIGMGKGLGVRSKQILAHGSLFTCSLPLVFAAYCLSSLLAISVPVLADTVEPEWAVRYNGPGGFGARAMVVDNSGNIYVTGSFSDGITPHTDYATIKYDANGNQLWMARYNGPGSLSDFASAIAIDNNGNVYVTGHSWVEGSINEYVTVKYDTNGNQLWVARYPGAYLRGYPGNFIAVDNNANVYMVGTIEGSNKYPEYVTVKYDSKGNQLWAAHYRAAEQSYNYPNAMTLDNAGNVYVTGESGIVGSHGTDYATVKYDTTGDQLWVARYNGPMDIIDRANSITVDLDGNCYVTGGSDITPGVKVPEINRYFVTIKYNPQGQELWVARYEGGEARDIALDGQRNVYIIGGPNRSGFGDIYYQGGDDVLVKYDKEGNQLWVAPYPKEVTTRALAIDHSGNAYVIGGSNFVDSYTVKYNNQGKVVWVAPYNPPGTDSIYYHKAIAVDNKGYIYVTGSNPYALLKYWLGVEEVEIKSSLNQTTFNKGETLTWDVALKGSGRVDVYLAVLLPSGNFICLTDTQGHTSAYNTPVPILQDWPIQTGTYRIISYPFNGKEPRGEYQLYIVFTKPRANPLDRSKWVIYDASSFIVP